MSKLSEETKALRKAVRKQTIGYILTALGLVAGLAWNDAIKALIQKLFPLSTNGISAQFIYAAIITIIVVVVSLYLTRLTMEEKVEDKKE